MMFLKNCFLKLQLLFRLHYLLYVDIATKLKISQVGKE